MTPEVTLKSSTQQNWVSYESGPLLLPACLAASLSNQLDSLFFKLYASQSHCLQPVSTVAIPGNVRPLRVLTMCKGPEAQRKALLRNWKVKLEPRERDIDEWGGWTEPRPA